MAAVIDVELDVVVPITQDNETQPLKTSTIEETTASPSSPSPSSPSPSSPSSPSSIEKDEKDVAIPASPTSTSSTTPASPTSTSSTRTAASAATEHNLESLRRLQTLVENKRRYPLNQEEFILFLEKKFCPENFLFLVDAEKYRAFAATNPEVGELLRRAEEIVAKFFTVGCQYEINVSSSLRDKAVKASKSEQTAAEAFTASINECRKLIVTGGYIDEFFNSAVQNISTDEINARYGVGACALGIAVGLWLILWLASGASRWVRLICILPYMFGFAFLTSAQAGTCSGMAAKGVKMTGKTKWWEAFKKGSECSGARQVEDSEAIRLIQSASRRLQIKTMIGAVIMTIIAVAVPDV